MIRNSGFSRQPLRKLRYLCSLRITGFDSSDGFACPTRPRLAPVSSFLALTPVLCPHSSDDMEYRNMNLLSIDYAFQPRLRSRLTQSRSALLWKPWIFGRKDSHLPLATHSGILSSISSTAPSGTASSRIQCSSTDHYKVIPELR